jgi:preprotein translocase subunit SecG
MGIIETLLLVVFAISAILLIIVVLMQDDQGEGLGGIFGGGSSSTPFGSSSGNVLTKITSVLGVIFIVSSLGMAYISRTVEDDDVLGEARRSATEQTENWFDDNGSDNSSDE